ncbi:MAG: hypothetical protein LBT04_00865, partial [Prevotellaceae bacterium]|nr:hypothetical protein [Prevotellaceae bacterium]
DIELPADIQNLPYLNKEYDIAMKAGGQDKLYYFNANHLGSGSLITDGDGNTYQTLAYAPYGEDLVNIRNGGYDEPYKFTGYERDQESGLYYANARYYDPRISQFLSVDNLAEQAPHQSGYAYCSNNPINRIDPDGNWDIDVHAYNNRGTSGYAVFIVKDRSGNEVYRTVVKTVGSGRTRNVSNSDTPQGKYKILGYRKTGEGTSYERVSYGPNDLLALDYQGGEGEKRNGMHVHGGRQEGDYQKRTDYLMNTHGCMRINDADILELKNITNALEQNDPLETRGYLNLTDDLLTPVKYTTSADRHNAGIDQFPKTSAAKQNAGFALPCYVVPLDNPRDVRPPYKLSDYE